MANFQLLRRASAFGRGYFCPLGDKKFQWPSFELQRRSNNEGVFWRDFVTGKKEFLKKTYQENSAADNRCPRQENQLIFKELAKDKLRQSRRVDSTVFLQILFSSSNIWSIKHHEDPRFKNICPETHSFAGNNHKYLINIFGLF